MGSLVQRKAYTRYSAWLVIVLLVVTSNLSLDVHVYASTKIANSYVRHFSMQACFKKADDFNKEIMVASSNLSLGQAAIVISKAIPNPQFNFLYGWGPAWEYVVAGNNQQFGWTEEIQILGRRTKKMNVAKANYLQVAFQVEAVRFDIHNRVRRAYVDLAAAHAYANAIELQVKNSIKLLDIAQDRYDAGKAPGAEVKQAKLTYMQVKVMRNQALNKLATCSINLAQLLGEILNSAEIIDVDESTLFSLRGQENAITPSMEKELPALSELLPQAWLSRNDLKAQIQQAYSDKKSIDLAKAQRLPDPFIGFNYMFSTYKPFQPQYFSPTFPVPEQPGYLLNVAHETPIFYQYQGQINQAKATWLQDLKQNDQLKSQIAQDIVLSYEALICVKRNLQKYRMDLLPKAFTVAQLGRKGYELGKSDLATAILSQQQYIQLLFLYFDNVVAYHYAWADLEKAIGVPLRQDQVGL